MRGQPFQNLRGRAASSLFAAILLAFFACLLSCTAADPQKPKARVLLVTGIDYPGHVWRQTAPVLAEALRKDPRL